MPTTKSHTFENTLNKIGIFRRAAAKQQQWIETFEEGLQKNPDGVITFAACVPQCYPHEHAVWGYGSTALEAYNLAQSCWGKKFEGPPRHVHVFACIANHMIHLERSDVLALIAKDVSEETLKHTKINGPSGDFIQAPAKRIYKIKGVLPPGFKGKI